MRWDMTIHHNPGSPQTSAKFRRLAYERAAAIDLAAGLLFQVYIAWGTSVAMQGT